MTFIRRIQQLKVSAAWSTIYIYYVKESGFLIKYTARDGEKAAQQSSLGEPAEIFSESL